MTLQQETFFGASIRNFNGSIGWGTQPSTLTIGLVEDSVNGDSFDPPAVGSATIFKYGDWAFGGLLQSYNKEYGQQGNPIYSVQLEDPRELLSGVQLILQDYSGSTFGMSNIYNIYGNLESVYGFGGSQSNDTGVSWALIRDSFFRLQLVKPIEFRGTHYILDPFVGLDLLPSYYRIGGDSISALEYVSDICEAISCDFFVDMVELDRDDTIATHLIKIRLVNKTTPLISNSINDFVTSTTGAVSKQSGYELSKDVMGRFVVGGKVNNLYFQAQAYTQNNTIYDDVILPFWGHDASGNLAIGVGDFNGPTGHEYVVTIDGRPLYLQTGKTNLINYTLDLAELHAARAGQDSWESFLWFYDSDRSSIHFGKATSMGLISGKLSAELMLWLKEWKDGDRDDGPSMTAFGAVGTSRADLQRSNMWSEDGKRRVSKVYAHINQYATEFYGKRFMVRVPFVSGTLISETNQLKFSLTPSQTGYVEESWWGTGASYGYMPYNPEKFTSEDNRLYTYARFAQMSQTEYEDENNNIHYSDYKSKYGLEKLSVDNYILDQYPNQKLGAMRENLFVKCSISDQMVFLNKNTLFSPRIVVTLSGEVPDSIRNRGLYSTGLLEEVKLWLKLGDGPTDDEVDDWAMEFGSLFGNNALWKPKDANLNIPDMVAVALESQVLRYGPWYISNGSGRVEFENDSSLVPWSYGSFTAMDNAGWAKVTSALTSQQVHETGSVEYPGTPTLSLGSALRDGGPTITDLSVSIGQDGVKTSYRMATWKYQFGRLGKYNVDRFARMSKMAKEQRKAFRTFYGYKPPINYVNAVSTSKHTADVEEDATAAITAEMSVSGSGDSRVVVPNVVGASTTSITKHLHDDTYKEKAGASLDAMFVPYTTNPDSLSATLPKFETPTSSATTPNVTNLNPFGGDGVSMTLPDTDDGKLPDDLVDQEHVKSIALRSPLVVAGWGYDTGGDPVPSGGSGGFYPNYKKRADQWKVGPVDLRWDNDRKVWAAGATTLGSSIVQPGVLAENVSPEGKGTVTLHSISASGANEGFFATGDTVEAYDFLLRPNTMLYTGDKVIVSKISLNTIEVLGSGGCREAESGYLPSSTEDIWMILNLWSPC